MAGLLQKVLKVRNVAGKWVETFDIFQSYEGDSLAGFPNNTPNAFRLPMDLLPKRLWCPVPADELPAVFQDGVSLGLPGVICHPKWQHRHFFTVDLSWSLMGKLQTHRCWRQTQGFFFQTAYSVLIVLLAQGSCSATSRRWGHSLCFSMLLLDLRRSYIHVFGTGDTFPRYLPMLPGELLCHWGSKSLDWNLILDWCPHSEGNDRRGLADW